MITRFAFAAICMAALTLATLSASAQNYGRMILCKGIRDNAERLQCYDRAAAEPAGSTGAPASSNESTVVDAGNWIISESRSPDGSPQLAAVLQASEGVGALVVRCFSRSTDIYVTLRTYLGGSAEALPVTYRINNGTPVETRWLPSRDGNAVFVPTITLGIGFLRSLPEQATIAMTIRDFQSRTNEVSFELGPMNDVRDRIASVCNWPVELRKPLAPQGAAPQPASAPAAAPRQSPPGSAAKGKMLVVQPHQHRWNVRAERR